MDLRRVAGVLSVVVAAVHVGAIVVGAPAYRWLGAGEDMARAAASGSAVPGIVTAGLAVLFGAWAWWAFAATGDRRKPPGWRVGMIGIGAAYLLRGLLLVPEVIGYVAGHTPPVVFRQMVFSLFALLAGAAYLLGARRRAPGGLTK